MRAFSAAPGEDFRFDAAYPLIVDDECFNLLYQGGIQISETFDLGISLTVADLAPRPGVHLHPIRFASATKGKESRFLSQRDA